MKPINTAISVLRLNIQWPVKELLKSSLFLLSIYWNRNSIRKYYLKLKAYFNFELTRCHDNTNSDLNYIKTILFKELENYLKESKKPIETVKVLEVGIGTGANLKFYPSNVSITGLDSNPFCEQFVYKHLIRTEVYSSKQRGNKLVNLNDFIIGFGENMSYVRTNSVDCIVCTNYLDECEDYQQVLKEIHRILKPVC
jgi:SAM-dependent methyltransferase